jgi:hypothetical protein
MIAFINMEQKNIVKKQTPRCTNIITGAVVLVGAGLLAGCSTMGGSSGSTVERSNMPQSTAHPPYHFAESRPATGKNVFIFDPKQTAWAAYNPQGQLVRDGIASGGSDYCTDLKQPCRTPAGKFTVYREEGENCKSHTFPLGKGGAPMPNCMYFNGGYAVHGSYEVPNWNASHGCIRVLPSDAAWLNDNIINVGTTVIVENY